MDNTPILGQRPHVEHQFNYQLSMKPEIQGTNVSTNYLATLLLLLVLGAKPCENPQSTDYQGHEIML